MARLTPCSLFGAQVDDLLLELPGRFKLAMVFIVHDRAAATQISERMMVRDFRILMERVAAGPSRLIRNDPDFGAPV